MTEGTKLKSLEKDGNRYWYRGRWWELNEPVKSSRKDKKMMVLASKTVNGQRCVKLIHFGGKGFGHNTSAEARRNYLKRSALIQNKYGEYTKNDHWSPNYWSRKILWAPNAKPGRPSRTHYYKTRRAA